MRNPVTLFIIVILSSIVSLRLSIVLGTRFGSQGSHENYRLVNVLIVCVVSWRYTFTIAFGYLPPASYTFCNNSPRQILKGLVMVRRFKETPPGMSNSDQICFLKRSYRWSVQNEFVSQTGDVIYSFSSDQHCVVVVREAEIKL